MKNAAAFCPGLEADPDPLKVARKYLFLWQANELIFRILLKFSQEAVKRDVWENVLRRVCVCVCACVGVRVCVIVFVLWCERERESKRLSKMMEKKLLNENL